ncbi:dephospho-CoA kinase [Chromatiaceae bacterium AAb-1]|nr:dephospho-CoA kinase [Chromatiaceae bacterium AAb-1]
MATFVVGLTGGIGSGKSTVASLFQHSGVPAVDADIVAREVVAPGSDCLQQIRQHFGAQVLTADGELNRSWLREQIFSQPQQKIWLDQLLHPVIREQLLQQLAAVKAPYALLIAPLLLENNLTCYVDRVLIVDIPEQLQLQRTLARDKVSEQQVSAIMSAQISRQDRLKQADDIITNDGTVAELQQQVSRLHQHYLQLAAQKDQARFISKGKEEALR